MILTESCIICQKNIKGSSPIGTAAGRKMLLKSAEEKDDAVSTRIQATNSENSFVYHAGNICYKPYVLSKPALSAQRENKKDGVDTMIEIDKCASRNSLRTSGTCRENPSSGRYVRDIQCVICNNKSKDNVFDKHRLELDNRVDKFLKVAKNRLDDVYNRISDCTDTARLYGADVCYHSKCMRNYVRETKTADNPEHISDDGDEIEDFPRSNREALENVVAPLTPALLSGTGFTLSEVRDRVNEFVHPNQIYNYQVKFLLIEKLSNGIKFCPSTRKNEPLMFFFGCSISGRYRPKSTID